MAIYLAIKSHATNMGKWDVPEKSYESAVQHCQLNHSNMLTADYITKK